MKPQSLAKMKNIQQEARQRILARGKIEFRVEPELMSRILDIAKQRKVALGPMVRLWVKDRLEQEMRKSTARQSQLDVIEQKLDQLLSNEKRRESA